MVIVLSCIIPHFAKVVKLASLDFFGEEAFVISLPWKPSLRLSLKVLGMSRSHQS